MADAHAKEKQLEREIAQRVEPTLPGIEVLAVELTGPDRMCVYVDHPAGVDHALCARVTTILDPYRREYGIDVSSPGFQRPLRKPAHFERAVGRRILVRTATPIAGRKRFRGEVLSAGARTVSVAAGDDPVDIPYEEIVRGNVIDEG
jgi:ribosome maturation factor RimP